MKYTNLRAFEKHLEGSAPQHFSQAYLVVAKEHFDRKTAVERFLFHLLKGQKNSELCTKIFEGDALNIDDVIAEMNSISFFTERMAIVINQADKLKKAALQAIEEYLNKPTKGIYLILSATSLTSTTNFYKKIEKIGIILDVPQEKSWEKEKTLSDWVGGAVAAAGKQIDQSVSQFLVKQIGSDQMVLQQEVEKLLCYIGERKMITLADVSAVSCSVNIETVFQLGEAIFRRDAKNALGICKALIADGTVLIVLLKQLRTQFQTDYQVCSILAQGGTSREVAVQFPYMKGFILDRHIQAAQNYGAQRFKKGIICIDDMDVKAKNSSVDPEALAELLMVQLTS